MYNEKHRFNPIFGLLIFWRIGKCLLGVASPTRKDPTVHGLEWCLKILVCQNYIKTKIAASEWRNKKAFDLSLVDR